MTREEQGLSSGGESHKFHCTDKGLNSILRAGLQGQLIDNCNNLPRKQHYLAVQDGAGDFFQFPEVTPMFFVPVTQCPFLLVHLMLLDLCGPDHPVKTVSCLNLEHAAGSVESLTTETYT
jgi:hypothetical protein